MKAENKMIIVTENHIQEIKFLIPGTENLYRVVCLIGTFDPEAAFIRFILEYDIKNHEVRYES